MSINGNPDARTYCRSLADLYQCDAPHDKNISHRDYMRYFDRFEYILSKICAHFNMPSRENKKILINNNEAYFAFRSKYKGLNIIWHPWQIDIFGFSYEGERKETTINTLDKNSMNHKTITGHVLPDLTKFIREFADENYLFSPFTYVFYDLDDNKYIYTEEW